ncbi:MAG: B12-binding domain-containing radical SAM protein [Bacteroidetes bacterium CG02_land_8_20_14_3_00_31_25]|nr:MAG: B12-binding domain-containing radical SAM protein [Bacteroidetes bacterium CG02_land_8_20_14_3_00_31_25]PIX35693.1 MAG: B12-binding domain-containing radical SAM protein [Bacteroidetes bacterium CG_4_8_14_3_um_filter_31_14]
MNKSILFISANQLKEPYPVYPLGISYLVSYLEEHLPDLKILLFDFNKNDYSELVQLIKKEHPKYIGVSFRNIDDVNFYAKNSYIAHYKAIVDLVKVNSKATIIIGGPGYSIFPIEMYNLLQPDFGIYGEGEISLYKLINILENNKNNFEDVPRLIYKKDNKTIFNQKGNSTLQPKTSYNKELTDYYWQNSGMLNIQTKRGCPYNCIYCTYPLIEGKNVRTHNPEILVENIEKYLYENNVDYFFFTDSLFNLKNKFNYKFAELILRKNIKFKWGAYFNFKNLPEDLLVLLKRAGLTHIEFGTDSLCDITLNSYRKPFTFEEILNTSDICNKLDIDFAHFLILGGYGETKGTLKETFENSKKIGRTVFFTFVGMRIYPNTELYKIAINEGKIQPTDDLLLPKYYVTEEYNEEFVKQLAKESGKRWVFPDEDSSAIINKLRMKGKKGPLWEYLTK